MKHWVGSWLELRRFEAWQVRNCARKVTSRPKSLWALHRWEPKTRHSHPSIGCWISVLIVMRTIYNTQTSDRGNRLTGDWEKLILNFRSTFFFPAALLSSGWGNFTWLFPTPAATTSGLSRHFASTLPASHHQHYQQHFGSDREGTFLLLGMVSPRDIITFPASVYL